MEDEGAVTSSEFVERPDILHKSGNVEKPFPSIPTTEYDRLMN